jgi:hypothetical protein
VVKDHTSGYGAREKWWWCFVFLFLFYSVGCFVKIHFLSSFYGGNL